MIPTRLMIRQSGSFFLATAILAPIFLTFIFLTLEMNSYFLKYKQLQVSLEAAALAGSAQLNIIDKTALLANATSYYNANIDSDNSQINLTIGVWDATNKTFSAATSSANAIKAHAEIPFIAAKLNKILTGLNITSTIIAVKIPFSSASYLAK